MISKVHGTFNGDFSVDMNGAHYDNYLLGFDMAAHTVSTYVKKRKRRKERFVDASNAFVLALKDYLNTKRLYERKS